MMAQVIEVGAEGNVNGVLTSQRGIAAEVTCKESRGRKINRIING